MNLNDPLEGALNELQGDGRYAELLPRVATALRERLTDEEYAHSVQVANTAAALATVYSVDAADAFLAGLLHDWDKCLEPAVIVEKAVHYGIEVPLAAQRTPKLLHAYTAAAELAERYPELVGPVIAAIRHHTVGSVGMADLEKLIYVADMIEPHREHAGAETLREMVGSVDLDTLFREAFEQTAAHLIEKRRLIHPDTVVVWNWLQSHRFDNDEDDR